MSGNTKVEFNFNIRKASRGDMVQVFNMIKALAVFEKMEDQVKINATTLVEDGFDSENPAFKCLVAEETSKNKMGQGEDKTSESKIVAYALYYYCYSTWRGKSLFLEDIYVQDEYRRHGIGKKLFLAVAKEAHESSGRLDFHVLSWNPAIEFYKRLGAVNLTETECWNTFRLDEKRLNNLFK